VSFFQHGRAFVIHQPRRFVTEVMPRFFRQSKLTSFQRQLNLYGFKRISQGPDHGGYFHEFFLRGRPALAAKMRRTRLKGTPKAKSNPEFEPNFYAMPPIALTNPELIMPPPSSMIGGTRAGLPVVPTAAATGMPYSSPSVAGTPPSQPPYFVYYPPVAYYPPPPFGMVPGQPMPNISSPTDPTGDPTTPGEEAMSSPQATAPDSQGVASTSSGTKMETPPKESNGQNVPHASSAGTASSETVTRDSAVSSTSPLTGAAGAPPPAAATPMLPFPTAPPALYAFAPNPWFPPHIPPHLLPPATIPFMPPVASPVAIEATTTKAEAAAPNQEDAQKDSS